MKILSRISVLMLVVLLALTSFATADEKDVLKALEKIKANNETDTFQVLPRDDI